MKVIDLLNKIANGELEENTRFYDKYKHKEYIYKPSCYSGIYPENNACANENWYLTLEGGSFRLEQEVEIIEDTPKEDKKKIEKFYFSVYQDQKLGGREVVEPLETKINEIIDKINGE